MNHEENENNFKDGTENHTSETTTKNENSLLKYEQPQQNRPSSDVSNRRHRPTHSSLSATGSFTRRPKKSNRSRRSTSPGPKKSSPPPRSRTALGFRSQKKRSHSPSHLEKTSSNSYTAVRTTSPPPERPKSTTISGRGSPKEKLLDSNVIIGGQRAVISRGSITPASPEFRGMCNLDLSGMSIDSKLPLTTLEDYIGEVDNPEEIKLTSPRSIEACLRTGINPKELIHKPRHLFEERGVPSHIAELRFEYYESRRNEKLEEALEARRQVAEEQEQETNHSKDSQKPPKMIEKEKDRLKKILKANQTYMEQLEAYDAKMQKLAEESNRRIEKQRKQQQEEKKRKQEELVRIEKERERKQKERKERIEKQKQEREKQVRQQERSWRENELERKKNLMQQRAIAAAKGEENRRKNIERVREVKEQQARLREEQRIKFEEKERQAEERRKEFEEYRRQEKAKQREKAQQKAERIKRIKSRNQQMEEQRIQQAIEKQKRSEERRKELQKERERKQQLKHEKEAEKERERQEKFIGAKLEQDAKVNWLLEKQEQAEESLEKTKAKRRQEAEIKLEKLKLKEEDRRENVDRMQRMREYERMRLLDKIEQKLQRGKEIDEQRAQLVELREKQRKLIDSKKKRHERSTPGPGDVPLPDISEEAPAFTFGVSKDASRARVVSRETTRDNYGAISPGPAAYAPKKATRNKPSFSFGRASRFPDYEPSINNQEESETGSMVSSGGRPSSFVSSK
eukprot:gb/GECH01014104.1/.p1 GENE.gb/GECH01014104.1/~~gb/GECH01014104.1/.p1  ORF type:complete len:743 (+),score=255.34 gb/GECH01014104.1/:1-2229(+)